MNSPLELKKYLDPFLKKFNYSKHLSQDPILFIHRYQEPRDQEVVALLASSLAYGRVEKILEFLERLFQIMGPSPYQFIIKFDPERDRKLFHDFTYRFHRGRHIACFIYLISKILNQYGSLEKFFLKFYSEDFPQMEQSISQFVHGFLNQEVFPFYRSGRLPKDSPVRFFLPNPKDGSTCKRLCLFLRWMVRGPDSVDLGVWKKVRSKDLIIPLDTHVARISRYLGLTSSLTYSWKTSCEITESLKLLDSSDPVKYDFALCHLGISGDCPSRQDILKCKPCSLRPVCRCWNECFSLEQLSC
ncbi:MAG: TIGR02757 family protein [Chlamydiae bacterium]|nr:TIGR02757 family protein [Chlamydiota bacterium]MBI3276430.1 TIGR02757 family protein [Chlamydiota bacterium]